MNYEIKYHLTNNSIQSNNHLYIYDFGNIKGFLYDNEFKHGDLKNENSKIHLSQRKSNVLSTNEI